MIRHEPYFKHLSTLELDSVSWSQTLAGLGVLSLVDAARENEMIVDTDWTGVRAVSGMVGSLHDGNPVRRPLTKVIDELRGGALSWPKVTQHLFTYGRALDLDGSWCLAVDVFGMVADFAREDRDPQLAMEATTALGGAARRAGDWDGSAGGYADAAHYADALNDKAAGLTVRVGTANTHIAKGNLPGAHSILADVVGEADAANLDGVLSIAYHAQATVAHLKGDFAHSVKLAHMALERTGNEAVRDTITADIAAGFVALGMYEAARDAHLVVSLTSRYQWVRWQASINLMELASFDGMEEAFDGYARDLRNAALDPRLRSYFLLYYGQGCARFGRFDEATASITDAQDFATRNKIHQVAFDAQAALAEGERVARVAERARPWNGSEHEDLTRVAQAFTQLREAAISSSPSADGGLTLG